MVGGTERNTQRFYSTGYADQRGDEDWLPSVPAGQIAPWTRTTIIRQFGINNVIDSDLDGIIDQIVGLEDDDFDGEFDNPLAAGTLPGGIHLKQVEVQIQGEKDWAHGGGAGQITVETLKAF